MAVWRPVRTHQVRVFLVIPAVQLEDEGISTPDPVVEETMRMVRIALRMPPEQGPVPGAAGLHVPDRNQGLRSDRRPSRESHRTLEGAEEIGRASCRERGAI